MRVSETYELQKFIEDRIYSEFGRQPSRLRHWNKNALRLLFTEYLKPHYLVTRKNPDLWKIIDDVQKRLEYDQNL